HVDEVDHDDAAKIAQADLPDNFFNGIHVGLEDRVFQTGRLPDILAGVDIDRNQRLGLVDHDIATALQPDFRLQRFVDLGIKAELLKQRRVFRVQLYAPDQA